MKWNWQLPDWPNFTWDAARLRTAEQAFLLGSGMLSGTIKHLSADDQELLAVEAMSTEALTTSEIEGEILDRASVQSSIRRHLGLATDNRRIGPKEHGIAEVMVDLYQTAKMPLSDGMLFKWHRLVMSGIYFVRNPGAYRVDTEAMQIVFGNLGDPRVLFEAPPSVQVPAEMSRFIDWFNSTAPDGAEPLPALTRAGIAHLYFESIHPFEDGNGRIGRAIAEKALAQGLGQPALTALAATILSQRKKYYTALEVASTHNEITDWLLWFAGMAIEAQRRTLAQVEFLIDKAKLFDRLRGQLNSRQEKALLRMFQEGPGGFAGGMSAGKYAAITGASPATTTRDLVDLVSKGALRRDGEHKHARYQLTIPLRSAKTITINSQGELIEQE
ncbi:cell division protein Fic [Capsulimonas corticalis]|uniref:Cell division protein Fic n=1 Tax=Capsulimonas corticalis TaxID=2219043 RepID=A0A402D532_9BACT|nr:Fic family protein [Capsulimonas corticalis]BDI32585.1 cell division protein Fic [Capsulimonas corticalis]